MGKTKKKEFKFSYSGDTGEIDLVGMPKDDINFLVENGAVCIVRTANRSLYIANPYIFNSISPNHTLLKIFEKMSYCRHGNTCKEYAGFDNIHDNCNVCTSRIACTESELASPPFVNSFDNFEQGEPPKFDDEDDEEYMSYKKYLQTDYWKKFRKTVLEFYGEKCNWCGTSGEGMSFNIHHVRYGARFDEKIENVIPLCASCHRKAHGKG
jgi:hypothetical protein